MAKGESRGGGYDRNTDRRNIGLLASATMPSMASGSTNAPVSIGQLMTPSAGRIAPTDGGNVDNANVDELAKRNESFLTDPTNMNMLKQFGMTLAGGGSPGHAMYQALTVPERAAAANAKAQETGLDITQKQLNIQKTIKELTAGTEKTPTEMMKLLNEADTLDAAGRKDEAKLLRSRVYQLSQEMSLKDGTLLVPPGDSGGGAGAGTPGNAGIAPDGAGASAAGAGADGMPTVVNIPGGKADLEAQAATERINAAKQKDLMDGLVVGASADGLIDLLNSSNVANYTTVGIIGGNPIMNWLSQNSANARDKLAVINANFTTQALQNMRDASKTGGALGQVSDFENRMLASTLVNLSQTQDKDTLIQNLKTAKWLFDPNAIDQRAAISKQLADKKITTDEAKNQFDALMRAAVFGDGAIPGANVSGPAMDITVPPAYVPEEYARRWQFATPDQKRMMLNDEDRAKFDATVGVK